jgi:hypothetical protein
MNRKVLDLLNGQGLKKETRPVFVYGHVYMPHGPFLYDSTGKMKNMDTVRKEGLHSPSAYLEYLAYTNTEIMKLITDIRQHTQDKAAIVLMGDHGFRHHATQYLLENYQNFNAVYLPGRDYHLFYDSVSGVNQFKIVLNSLFQQAIPLQKDSTVFLTAMQ